MESAGSISLLSALCIVALGAGCSSDAANSGEATGGQGGSAGAAGASGSGGSGGAVVCDEPDTACPQSKPFPGSPCSGSLSCVYDEDIGIPWTFTCPDGRWEGEPDCSMVVGGCPVPPPAESCAEPTTSSIEATLKVGPAELGRPFREFTEGEAPEIEWGAQGGAMIFYRVQLDGQTLPDCVMVNSSLSAPGVSPAVDTSPVTLRCGESLRMYVIVPAGSCDGEAVETTLSVEVEGLGSTDVTLMVPGDAFCGTFG